MLLFDKGYEVFKQKYIVPLSDYRINYRALEKTSIKTALRSGQYTSFEDQGNSIFEFEFQGTTIFPALLADIWTCYIRSILQWDAACKIYDFQPNYCPNWSIVSDYYYSYYCACTLLRLTGRGNIYFDQETAKEINNIISDLKGTLLSINSNSVYYITKSGNCNDSYVLLLKPSGAETHTTIWRETAKVLREMKSYAQKKSEEETLLSCIDDLLTSLGDAFPSKLRNAVNYQLPYGLKAINNKIFPSAACKFSDKWLDPIIFFKRDKRCDDNDLINLFRAYAYYLHTLVTNLIFEYNNLQGRGNGIETAINKRGLVRTSSFEPQYTY